MPLVSSRVAVDIRLYLHTVTHEMAQEPDLFLANCWVLAGSVVTKATVPLCASLTRSSFHTAKRSYAFACVIEQPKGPKGSRHLLALHALQVKSDLHLDLCGLGL